jgi:rifampicin phosphotransferase
MAAFRTDWDTEPNPVYDVWTITNGGEILPGVLSPFVATLYNDIDARGLRALMSPYPAGHRVKVFKPPIGNFFGIIAGRLALNVGFSVAAMSCLDPDIATAMASQFFQGTDDAARLLVKAPAAEIAASMEVAERLRAAAEQEALDAQQELYEERLSVMPAVDRTLPLKAAWQRLMELLVPAGEQLNRHLMVSTAAGEMQVRLAGVIVAGGGDPSSIVGLCSGLGNVESAKPALALYDLAQVARRQPTVRSTLESGDMGAVLTAMEQNDRLWEVFIDEYDEFIHRYGFRVQGEADPTVPDWSENPAFVISQVRSMLALKPTDSPGTQIKRATAAREKLEKRVRTSLAADHREAFDVALAQAQRFTALRELTKAVWVLSMRHMRPTILAIGDGLAAAGHLRHAHEYVYCTYREVETLARGRRIDDLPAIITRRKKQRAVAEQYVLPNSWVGTATPSRKKPVTEQRRLAGLGVSAGTATGRARIVMNTEAAFARDIGPGDVLVAPFTDTPWTPLFIPAAAVVVETGGMLSHAATVAREFGIPCVVLVDDATRVIREGDTVTVDGAAGTVTIDRRATPS